MRRFVDLELRRIVWRVLINTRAGGRYGADNYVQSGYGMGRDATLYLLERGVRVTGTDAWSWDAPFTKERVKPVLR
jgi:kynurenine formamidase